MPDQVQFELVTPERLLLSEAVEMVVVPGTEGNFGVLPGHALLISTIRPGTIEVYEGQQVTRRIFVVGGFAEVTPERCTVLADEAAPAEELDRAAIEAELQIDPGQSAEPARAGRARRQAPSASASRSNCTASNATRPSPRQSCRRSPKPPRARELVFGADHSPRSGRARLAIFSFQALPGRAPGTGSSSG